MSVSEDQLRKDLGSAPDDWSKRSKLVERLADRWAGQEMDMLLTASPNAPATETEMRRVVELANTHCPGYRGLKHVLGLFLETHLTSSWAHFIQAQAQFHTGEVEEALRHYQTSRSLNPARSDPELDQVLAERGVPAVTPTQATVAPAAEPERRSVPTPVPPKPERQSPVPVPPKQEETAEEPPDKAPEPAEESEPSSATAPDSETEAAAETEASPAEKTAEAEPPEDDLEVDVSDRKEEDKDKESEIDSREDAEEKTAADSSSTEGEDDQKKPAGDSEKSKDDEKEDPDSPFHTEAVGEHGEPFTAAKKENDSRERLSALSIAVMAHVFLLILFAFWVVVKPRPDPPMFVSSVVTDGVEERAKRPELKRYQRPKMPSATAQAHVMTAPAISAVALPEMPQSVATFDPIGNGDDFGPSMSFGGGGGGSVSFFGSKATSKRVVFVVDVSASMGSGAKDQLMRKELTESVQALPPTVEYAVIFFSGPAWYAGQKVGDAGLEGRFWSNVVRDGNQRYVWYEGWSEKERHDGSRTSALYHYSLGPDKLPMKRYQRATKTNIRKTVEQIEQVPLTFGTDWRWPLKMAMNMGPDTIFFMTDGAFGTGRGVSKDEMISDLLEYNRRKGGARINTICMMVLQARNELEKLARVSGGEFTLVLQDGTVVRGNALDDL